MMLIIFLHMLSSIQQQRARARRQRYRANKRSKDQAEFRAQHQLPPDAVIIRVRKLEVKEWNEGADNNLKLYNQGCLAFVDSQTGKLICCTHFIPLLSLDSKSFHQYDHVVSTVYRHGLARNIVKRNKAADMIPPERRSGQMFAIGCRSPLFTSDENAGESVLMLVNSSVGDLIPKFFFQVSTL